MAFETVRVDDGLLKIKTRNAFLGNPTFTGPAVGRIEEEIEAGKTKKESIERQGVVHFV